MVLAIAKQRSLCLTDGHRSCATFVAAREGIESAARPSITAPSGLWPEVHTAPIVLEQAHVRLGPLPVGGPRLSAQLILGGLMVVALVVLVLARLVAPPIDGPQASGPAGTQPGGVGGSSASPTVTSSRSPAPPPVSTGSPSLASDGPQTTLATLAPLPSIATNPYTVQAGDTLSSIASRFDTTVSVLAALNGISDPRLIRIGQVLRVPAP